MTFPECSDMCVIVIGITVSNRHYSNIKDDVERMWLLIAK